MWLYVYVRLLCAPSRYVVGVLLIWRNREQHYFNAIIQSRLSCLAACHSVVDNCTGSVVSQRSENIPSVIKIMAGVKITVDNFGLTKQPGTDLNLTVQRFTFTNDNGTKVQVNGGDVHHVQ